MTVLLHSSNHEVNWFALPKVKFTNKNFVNENFIDAIESDLASLWIRQDESAVNIAWRELQHIYKKVREQLRPGMHEPGELDPKLILPVLIDVLGFHQRKKKFTPPNADFQIEPDHLLFPSQSLASKFLEDRSKIHRDLKTISAICESKSWGLDLDIKSSADELSPHEQVMRDLRQTGAPYAILTNGLKWRLYSRESLSRPAHYFEMSLPLICEAEEPDYFEVFYNFFSLRALAEIDGVSHVRRLQEMSSKFGATLEKTLRIRMYSAVEFLLNGRYLTLKNEKLADHYNAAIMLMYRVLFILKAEDSALLPIRDSEAYRPISLRSIADEAARMVAAWELGREEESKQGVDLFERLAALSRVIDTGSPQRGIPVGFNGGLFSESQHPNVFKVKIDNFHLANALFRSTRIPSDDAAKSLRVNFDSINYQHIGSVYEGLLEFEPSIAMAKKRVIANDQQIEVIEGTKSIPNGFELLRDVAKGEAYLEAREETRKNTGSYYTPQWIVTKTLELTGFTAAVEAAKSIEELKAITICDPAMGSGHFLVDAAALILRKAQSLYVNGDRRSLEEMLESVLLSTVFGVDKNGLAVMLARLNIWILVGKKDRKLPSLEENIKEGNSLMYAPETAPSRTIPWFAWDKEFKKPFSKKGFDFIVGNPPWGGNIAEEKSNIEYIFKDVSIDNLNSFDLFVRQALRLVHQGGRIAFVLPRNVIRTSDYGDLRKAIGNNVAFIGDVGAAFDGVMQEAVILGLAISKQKMFKSYAKLKAAEFGATESAMEYSEVPTSTISEKLNWAFNIYWDKVLDDLHACQFNEKLPLLSEKVDRSRGIECGASGEVGKCPHCSKYISRPIKKKKSWKNCDHCGKRVTLEDLPAYNMISPIQTTKHRIPIFSGRLIQKFSSEEPRYIQTGLAGVDYKSRLFDGRPTIFMTKISDSLKCDIALDGEYATQGVYTLKAKNEEEFPLLWVAAFINSEFAKFLHEYRYNMGASLTTNVLLDHITNLRITFPPRKSLKSIENHVSIIKKHGLKSAKGTVALERIDLLVYEAFGITKRQQDDIRVHLDRIQDLKSITQKQVKSVTTESPVEETHDNEILEIAS